MSDRLPYEDRLEKARQLVSESQAKGNGSLRFACDLPPITFVSSGIQALDQLTGSYSGDRGAEQFIEGGFPMGRYTVVWGVEQAGKSTLMFRFIANAQRQGKLCLLVDAENRATADWMARQGVDLDTLLWHSGGIMEEGLQDLVNMIELVDFVVVDTVHALVPKAEVEDNKGKARDLRQDAPMGRQAFALNKFFKVATARVAKAQVGVVLVGQARDAAEAQRPVKTLSGGNALRHYATLRLKISKITAKDKVAQIGLTDQVPKKKVRGPDGTIIKEVPVGFLQKILLEKAGTNHLEGRSILVPFLYGLGPDDFESNVMAAVGTAIASPSAGRYEIPTQDDPIKIHGREALLRFFRENQDHYDWVMAQITSEEEDGLPPGEDESNQDDDQDA